MDPSNPTDQTPRYLTRYALARLLKEFAAELGLSEFMADVASQVHLQRTTIPDRWSEFVIDNCSSCAHNMNTCSFLNPKPENCVEGATPDTVKAANAIGIERGKLRRCPVRKAVQDG
jgi:hypothetical protein